MFGTIKGNELFNINSDNAAMPKDLKILNRAKILSVLRQSDKITVNEVAEITGISRQTVIKSIESFLNSGIVVSMGKGSSTSAGGKKPEIFKFNQLYKYNVCVRFENNNIIVALMDLKSNITSELRTSHIENQRLEVILLDFSRLYHEILTIADITEDDIWGIGFCTGGICDMNTGIMRYNSLYPNWGQDIPIVEMIKKYVKDHIVVLVANDAKMTGISEIFYDNSLESKKIVALHTLDGISAGLIDNGSLILGKHTLIGEIGHMTIDIFDTEPCQCGNTGCFEKLVSEKRLYSIINENQSEYKASQLYKLGADITLQDYFDFADKGDRLAVKVVEYLAKNFAVALKNICIISDPDLIIIQGKYSTAGSYFKQQLENNLKNFKYFPEDINNFIWYSKGELYVKALIGLSMILNNSLFRTLL